MDTQNLFKTSLTKLAYVLACSAHSGQVDKAGEPYIIHPMTVASTMQDEVTIAAALLHDVLEDTKFTEADLLELGITQEVVDVVVTMTRREGERYFDYIERVGADERARCVKLADLRHNSDLSRLTEITERDKSRYKRYQKAIEMLTARTEES